MSEDTNKDARAAVAAVLTAAGITYSVSHAGARTEHNGKPWECDAWFITFARLSDKGAARTESFDYYTGSGHRKPPPMHQRPRPPYRPGTIAHADYVKTFKAVAPQAADVLYSLLLDSSAVGQSFESWASDFGYDTDSRAAEATYRACQQNADKLSRVIDATTRAELSRILEGF
jgi:hypothetical protein